MSETPSVLPLSKIVGQPEVLTTLEALLESGDTPPPLLFSGPEGCGKRSTALAFAASLVCQNRQGFDGCGRCGPCQRVAGADAVTALREKSTSADNPMNYPDIGMITVPRRKTRISILQARDICQSMTIRPFECERRIYLVEPADAMTPSAANSLLKVLEEPPPFGVLILVTAAPWSLPITVRSRLRTVRFRPLSTDLIRRLLEDQGIEGPQAQARAIQARGSVSRAILIDPESLNEQLEIWVRLLEQLGHDVRPGALAVAAGETFAADAATARSALDLLIAVLRDMAAAAEGVPPLLLDDSQAQRLAPIESRVLGSSGERSALVDRLAGEIRIFNRNPRLAVEGVVLALGGALTLRDLPAL